jgi:HEAT repeat protein
MTLESALQDLPDPEKRLTSSQLISFSNLDDEESEQLKEVWLETEASRRLTLLTELADLAEDNVELSFDAVFKQGLYDDDAYVRAAAIRGLYEYEGTDVIPVLADLLQNDPDADVRREAAIALGRFALAAEFGQLPDGDAEAVKRVLTDCAENLEEDELVRARAIESLGAISGEETQNLIESIYEEGSLWLQIGAVDAMGRSCDEVWLPLILNEMENAAPEMRHAAAFAAGSIGDDGAVDRLFEMAVRDPDRQVQLAAVRSLGEIGGKRAKVALNNLLYEGDDDLREAIEEAMLDVEFGDDPLGTVF